MLVLIVEILLKSVETSLDAADTEYPRHVNLLPFVN
jgi:hypothetical protein